MNAMVALVKAGHANRPLVRAYLQHPEWRKIWMHMLDAVGVAVADEFEALHLIKQLEAEYFNGPVARAAQEQPLEADSIRRTVQERYYECRRKAAHQFPPSTDGSDNQKIPALFAAYANCVYGPQARVDSDLEARIYLELAPFFYLESDVAVRTLAEYLVWREQPSNANLSLLRSQVQQGVRLAEEGALSSSVQIAREQGVRWIELLQPAAKPATAREEDKQILLPPSRGGEWRDYNPHREEPHYIADYADLLADARENPEFADFDELRLAYTRTPGYAPYELHREAWLSYNMAWAEGNYRGALLALVSILESNYLDIRAHLAALDTMQALERETGRVNYALLNEDFAEYLLNSIYASGDGESAETAYQVISVAEEYAVLGQLNADPTNKRLIRGEERVVDVFELRRSGSEAPQEVYFDVTTFFGNTDYPPSPDMEEGQDLLVLAMEAIKRGDKQAAFSLLHQFIAHVRERTGKEFDQASAQRFIGMAESLLREIN